MDELSQLEMDHLGVGDLHALCYELGVDYGSLRGKGSEAKARALYVVMWQQGRLDELAQAIRRRRAGASRMGGRKRLNWRVLAAGFIALLLLVAAGLLLPRAEQGEQERATTGATAMAQRPQQEAPAEAPTLTVSPTPVPTVPIPDRWTISYAEAAGWLDDLAAEDHDDQILDWAAWGLAGLLELDTKTVRDAFYDQTMLRDPIFQDLVANRVGPGRGIADARGILHVLAPAGDHGTARAIGMVLDDYRKDAGSDPERVLVYSYEMDRKAQQVILIPDRVRTTQDVRTEYGYREMRIGSLADLERFLEETHHLSRLEVRNGALWAGGWSWPGVPVGRVSAEDLTALQSGYRRAASGAWSEPGFSLDPGQSLTVAETLDLLDLDEYPKLRQRKEQAAAFVAALSRASTPQEQEAVARQYPGLVRDVFFSDEKYTQLLYLLTDTAGGRSPYQIARYDGGLQGTEAAMTYFYTDLVAKAWSMAKGQGVPTGEVSGFVSYVQAKTPRGHCAAEPETGRLWFGLREEAVSVYNDAVNLGSITTRVFTLVQDPLGGTGEIEPSYSFGRVIWWWDRHYLSMADYEPQYHRLDQLMRWGAAIAWLVEQGGALLPEVESGEVDNDWRFGDWMAAHPELKWRMEIPFVEPPDETTEALLTLYSEGYTDCGQEWRISGGISNPSIRRMVAIENGRPSLAPEVARGGLGREGTTYSPATGEGTIASLDGDVKRTLRAVEGDVAQVDMVAAGRKVWSLGSIKMWVSETAQRRFSLTLSATAGAIGQRLAVQGVELADLSVTTEGTTATVHLRRGPLDHARTFVMRLREALQDRSLLQALERTGESGPVYIEPGSDTVAVRMEGIANSRWFTIVEGSMEAGRELAFRLGLSGGSSQGVRMYDLVASDAPQVPGWVQIDFPGRGESMTRFEGAAAPGNGAEQMAVRYAHGGRDGVLVVERGQAVARSTDEIVGLEGTVDGVELMKPAMLEHLSRLRHAAEASGDGYARATSLATGSFLLVGDADLVIVPPGDAWHERVQAAIAGGSGEEGPLFKIDQDQLSWVVKPGVREVRPSGGPVMSNAVLDQVGQGRAVYVQPELANLMLEEGSGPPEAIGGDEEVRVVALLTESYAGEPDLIDLGETRWVRYHWPFETGGAAPARPTPTPEPGSRSVLLVYREGDCRVEQNTIRCGE